MSENRFKKGDWTNCRYDICEIIDEDDEVVCIVSLNDADKVIAILEENEQLRKELDSFKPVMFQDMRYGTVRLYSKGDV